MANARPKSSPHKAVLADGTTRRVPLHMTLEEFEAFPFREGDHWELINGETVLSPSPRYDHQKLIACLMRFLADVVDGHRPSEQLIPGMDVRAAESSSYVWPDIMVLPDDELLDDENLGPYPGVPLLVVESLSPTSHARDMDEKREIYERRGVPEYWVVDPATGALFVFARGSKGRYEQQPADEDGYVASPYCRQAIRIARRKHSYAVLTKNLRKGS